MKYFDAAYIAKCYLNEPGADRVREVARTADGLASCEFGRLEFFSIIKRHQRDRHITTREARDVLADFETDEKAGVWRWFPVTSGLVTRVCERLRVLPPAAVIRAGDALHLGCASEQGFDEVYTNDRHMLAGAPFFRLSGINVIEG